MSETDILATHYGLLMDDEGGVLRLTERGMDFMESSEGKTEGVLSSLLLVGNVGPASFGELIESGTSTFRPV